MPSAAATSRRVRRQLTAYDRGADLDYDEQEELVVKLRYGVGDPQIRALAAAAPADLPAPSPPIGWSPPSAAPDPDAAAKAVRRLGRGHALGRSWRR